MQWQYDLYNDLTVSLRLTFSTKDLQFSFEKSVRSLEKKAKKVMDIPHIIKVPDKFHWYILRQTKRYITLPKLAMERDGAKLTKLDLEKAEYDTTDKKDWKLVVYIQGTYEKVAVYANG